MEVKEFEGKKYDEIVEELQKRIQEFTDKVNAEKDLETLKKIELEIDKEQEAFDTYLREVTYPLPQEAIQFEGKKYTVQDITKKIIYFLNRHEQQFQYCLGLHGVVLFWKTAKDEIAYGIFDSTLHLLEQLKYKGDNEWTDILIVNNYLVGASEGYKRDRTCLEALAQMRNAVVSRIQLCSTPAEQAAKPTE